MGYSQQAFVNTHNRSPGEEEESEQPFRIRRRVILGSRKLTLTSGKPFWITREVVRALHQNIILKGRQKRIGELTRDLKFVQFCRTAN